MESESVSIVRGSKSMVWMVHPSHSSIILCFSQIHPQLKDYTDHNQNSDGQLQTLNIIAEFLSPFEDELNIIILGDHVNSKFTKTIDTIFNSVRTAFNKIPNIHNNNLNKAIVSQYNTSELFKGSANKQLKENSIVYLDYEISSQIVDMINHDDDKVDKLEAMLLRKHILEHPREKYILDITTITNQAIKKLIHKMDQTPEEFNYLILDNFMGVWLNQEFILP